LLLEKYDDFKDKSFLDFYSIVKSDIKPDISKLANGVAKTFYEGHSYQQLALCVKIGADLSKHKTIHKAKGDEFDNVLVILKNESDFSFLLNLDLKDEEQRIYYVAISRALERLYINTSSLPECDLSGLEGMFEIIKV
jgi:DNA helicase-2/ATP-dependent DNA helicase PcrA